MEGGGEQRREGRGETEEMKTVSAGQKKNVSSVNKMVKGRCVSEIELKQHFVPQRV